MSANQKNCTTIQNRSAPVPGTAIFRVADRWVSPIQEASFCALALKICVSSVAPVNSFRLHEAGRLLRLSNDSSATSGGFSILTGSNQNLFCESIFRNRQRAFGPRHLQIHGH